MSENNSFKKVQSKENVSPAINTLNEITSKKILNSQNISIPSVSNEQPGIMEVYEDNFIDQIKVIGELLEDYNYIGMDTEYPGTVYTVQTFTKDFYYKTMKMNIDSLKIIQLGITLTNSKGEYPKNCKYHTWQFNFEFDKKVDKITTSSLNLLEQCGIDFSKLKRKGIKHRIFAEYFMVSGLVLNPDIRWVSFHGCYDFGYLLKLLIAQALHEAEKDFLLLCDMYFINYYDIKTMVKRMDNLQGGLNKLAQNLEVLREGKTHQAGSDSVVTIDVYFKLRENGVLQDDKINKDKNCLFGIANEEDNKETIAYPQFAHLAYQGNSPNNMVYMPYLYNNSYYYLVNNNTQQPNNNPTQMPVFNI
jgi:CCR4-NOT transcription complex subunit 7/8